jgi:hypothetical protein
MSNLIIENTDFRNALKMMLNDDDDCDENTCLITGQPLTENFVTLECNHRFNYEPLYQEIYNQMFKYKTYDFSSLNNDERIILLKQLNSLHFIKCPYCRNIQKKVIPYYDNLDFDAIYGINSTDIKLRKNNIVIRQMFTYPTIKFFDLDPNNVYFEKYGKPFKYGCCCNNLNKFGDLCSNYEVAELADTGKTYCLYHYAKNKKMYINKMKKIRLEKAMMKKKQREELLNKRKKLFEEKNEERLKKGLPPLKNIPKLSILINKSESNDNANTNNECCIAILKTGKNKGTMCSKKVFENGFCKRHQTQNVVDMTK